MSDTNIFFPITMYLLHTHKFTTYINLRSSNIADDLQHTYIHTTYTNLLSYMHTYYIHISAILTNWFPESDTIRSIEQTTNYLVPKTIATYVHTFIHT